MVGQSTLQLQVDNRKTYGRRARFHLLHLLTLMLVLAGKYRALFSFSGETGFLRACLVPSSSIRR